MEVPASVGVPAVNSLRTNPERTTPESPAKESAAPIPESRKRAFDLYKSGREQFGMGNLEGAIQAYRQALEIEPGYADVYLSLGHAYVRQQKAIMGRADSRPLLPTIRCPTLLLVGEQDAATPPELSEEMAAAIPGARLVKVADCGHLSTLERPEAVTKAMVEWLGG